MGEPLPQLVLGALVEPGLPLQPAPLVEQFAQPVAGGLPRDPLGVDRGDRLGLLDQGRPLGHGPAPGLLPGGLGLGPAGLYHGGERGQPLLQDRRGRRRRSPPGPPRTAAGWRPRRPGRGHARRSIRCSSRDTWAARSSYLRAKYARASSWVAPGYWPTARSPSDVRTQTVPSSSTRPHCCPVTVSRFLCPGAGSRDGYGCRLQPRGPSAGRPGRPGDLVGSRRGHRRGDDRHRAGRVAPSGCRADPPPAATFSRRVSPPVILPNTV